MLLGVQLSTINSEDYRWSMPNTEMSFIFPKVAINFQFRMREDEIRYTVHNEMTAFPIDGSVSGIPIRAPNFFARFSIIQRKARDVNMKVFYEKQFLRQVYYSNLYLLDYEEQFFPEEEFIIDLKASKILNKKTALHGVQERFYWDEYSQRE